MTLGEFSTIVGAPVRWVQNARAALRVRASYGIEEARRLGLARVIAEATGMGLGVAFQAAGEALAVWPAEREWARSNTDGSVRIVVDVERYLSGFASRLSLSRNYYGERQRGRQVKRVREPIAAASEYGWDVTLLSSGLNLSPAQRLRRLDEASEFARTVRRIAP